MPSESESQQKIPNPIYAAAGAGDIALSRLRKLPEKVAALQEELPGRLTVIQDKVTQKVAEIPSIAAELRQRVVDRDTDKFREAARRNAAVLRTSAVNASEKVVAIYGELVARGETVLSGNGATASDDTTPPSERIHAEVLSAGNDAAPTEAETADEAGEAAEPEAPEAPEAAAKPQKKTTKPRKTA